MIEQMQPHVIDSEMRDAGDDLLQLHLLAGDGDEAGHIPRLLFLLEAKPDVAWRHQAVKPPSMTRLAPVM